MKYPVGSWLMVKVNDLRPALLAAMDGNPAPLRAAFKESFQISPDGRMSAMPFVQGMLARVVAAPSDDLRRVSIGGWDHETPVSTIDEIFEQVPTVWAAAVHNASRSAVGLDHDEDLAKL